MFHAFDSIHSRSDDFAALPAIDRLQNPIWTGVESTTVRGTSGGPSSPCDHLSKQNAERSRGCGAPGHAPQLEHQREVDERGDGGPRGVQSQTVLDLQMAPRANTGREVRT